MSSSSQISLSFLDENESVETESSPQALQTSSLVSISLTPSISSTTSLPREIAGGDDASAISAANYYNNNGTKKKFQPLRKKYSNKEDKRERNFCFVLSAILQGFIFLTSLAAVVIGWLYFEETLKYAFGISALLQFELFFVLLTAFACFNTEGCLLFACFNAGVLAILEHIVVAYVVISDIHNEECEQNGCTFIHGTMFHRAWFLGLHGVFGVIHFIINFAHCYECCKSSISSDTTLAPNPRPAAIRKSQNNDTSHKLQSRRTKSLQSRRSSFRSQQASSQASRASSNFSTTSRYSIRIRPSSSIYSSQQSAETPRQFYPMPCLPYQQSSTLCLPPLQPSNPCYQQSFIRQQPPFGVPPPPFHPNDRAMICDNIPKTQQPRKFVDVQRVVVKLPPLKPSESASVPPSLRDSTTAESQPREHVYVAKVTPLN